MDTYIDRQNKDAWCKYGEQQEEVFLSSHLSSDLVFFKNPEKSSNKYAHDIFTIVPSDIKTIRTKFFTSNQYGFDPDYAFTLNDKDVKRYTPYSFFLVVLDIKFKDMTESQIRLASISEILKCIKDGNAKLHRYLNRGLDGSGNALESWIMDYRWFPLL